MVSLANTRLVRTGDEDLDDNITFGFIVFVGALLWDVASIFWSAYKDATRSIGRRSSGQFLRKRPMCLFLALAIVGLFVVNGSKFEYLEFRVASWKGIWRLMDHVKGTSEFRRSSWVRSNSQSPGDVSSS